MRKKEDDSRLEGKELASYVETFGDQFSGNGDALCLATGYGIKSEDGSFKCNLTAFTNALSEALYKNENNLDD